MAPADGTWTLAHSGEEFAFGAVADGLYFASAVDLGAPEVLTDDSPIPRGDGRAFGEDFLGGRTVTFDLAAVEDGPDATRAVLDLVGRMGRAWRADDLRSTPGAVAELRTSTGRVVFGRPRRFAPILTNVTDGVALVAADFAAADDLFHDQEEKAVVVGLVPPPSGGLMSPLAAPLTTTQSGASKPGAITVGGDVAAWPVLTIHGPITNPSVEVVGAWRITLRASLAYDESVTIDTRPWARSVVTASGRSLGGALTRDSVRITRAKVPTGTHEVVLRGTDPTATSSLRFAWRDAYTTL